MRADDNNDDDDDGNGESDADASATDLHHHRRHQVEALQRLRAATLSSLVLPKNMTRVPSSAYLSSSRDRLASFLTLWLLAQPGLSNLKLHA